MNCQRCGRPVGQVQAIVSREPVICSEACLEHGGGR